jgi:type III restriction enzyme
MRLKFDPNQGFQLAAINSVVGLLEGLPETKAEFALGDEIVPNLQPDDVLYDSWLLDNLAAVRAANGIEEPIFNLAKDDGFELEEVNNDSWEFPSFTVEMETGTGKTYVYLRTIYELRKRYGFSKFIIIVPSIAIYEGVIKTEEITRAHFRSLYDNETVTLIPYDGSRISRVRIFATSTQAQILLMTIDAFNSKKNNIYKPSEKLPGERLPYQFIQETRPIIILDEPQSIDTTEKARSAIRTLHPLFGLRYSATHRTSPNLTYRLTPVDAYRQNLVKKIQVIGLAAQDNLNEKFLALESITQKPITARVKTYVQERGQARESTITLKQDDNLFNKTHRDEHRDGYIVREISAAEGNKFVRFENGLRLTLGETLAPSRPEIFRTQIEQTIRQHMETQEALLPFGIKVLSLFFIDRVANYTADEGIIKVLFDASFKKLRKSFPHFSSFEPADVREAYFAKSKPKKGETEEAAIDTSSSNAAEREAERAAFALIMREKERLLSFGEPVSFIFAHSALREGWDNPNVFQICTLRQTVSALERRQQIGRGLRLAVNQDGERVMQEDVNVLTVIADESYEAYADGLQREYVADGEEAPPKPKKPQTNKVHRRDAIYTSDDFQEFWTRLNRRTRYSINIDTDALVEECAAKLGGADFPEPTVVLTRGRFVITEFTIRLDSVKGDTAKLFIEIKDTDGNVDQRQRLVKARTDLAREIDDRLRGYKVLEIIGSGDDAIVKFTNSEELTRYSSINFKSEKGQKSPEQEILHIDHTYPVFNLIARAARETTLTRPTLNRILERLPVPTKAKLFKNPEGFSATFITEIKEAVADHVASRLEFTLDAEAAPHDAEELFPPEKSFPQKELVEAGARGLYDKVQWDSDIELNFVERVLRREEDKMIFYFKFPPAFKINLPKIIGGNYNPDWGIVRYDDDGNLKLQLVRETKGTAKLEALQFSSEGRKITCAMKHFKQLGIDYRHITGRELRWWASKDAPDADLLIN